MTDRDRDLENMPLHEIWMELCHQLTWCELVAIAFVLCAFLILA